MKIKRFLALCLAGASLTAFAQTHLEGMEYYKADQLENAKELLTRSLNNPSTDKAVSNYYLGMIAADEGNLTQAKNYFTTGIQQNAEYPFNYIGDGYIALKNGDIKGAEAQFKMAEKFAKKNPSVAIAIARAYNDVDPAKYEKQIAKQVEKARRQNMENPDIYIFEGDVLRAKKDIGGAATKYEMASQYDNKAAAAFVKYANLFTQVNPGYAIKMLGNFLQNNPQSALGQRELANAYYNNKDFTNAATEYGKYVNNPAHFKNDEDRYAFLLFYGQNYQQGYDYATKLLKENPSNFTAKRYQFMNAAQLESMKDQYLPLAEALYNTHKANPKENKFAAIDYTLIAEEMSKAGRGDEAVAVLNEAMNEMPNNLSFPKQLALVYVDQNNLPMASDSYEVYLSKNNEPNFNDYNQQATYAFYAGVQSKDDKAKADKYFNIAREAADKASKLMPDHYKPIKVQGDIAKQTADESHIELAAAPYYETAIGLLEASADPSKYASDAKEMYNYMGNYWLDMKDTAKAKTYFNKYLQYDPDNEAYRKFVDGLK